MGETDRSTESYMTATTFRWIGTGSAFNPALGHTSFTVQQNGGARILLVDCGATVALNFIGSGAVDQITDVAITHMHADHIGGLEAFAFYQYFVLGKRGDKRPNLHVANDAFAHMLWESALRGGMGKSQDESGAPLDMTLETFFRVRTGPTIRAEALPETSFVSTLHVAGMENYGLRFSNGVYYSGDTVELPPHDPQLIFQDCQWSGPIRGDVHICYERLRDEVPDDVKKRTHLVHLGRDPKDFNPLKDGFGGIVLPGQEFTV